MSEARVEQNIAVNTETGDIGVVNSYSQAFDTEQGMVIVSMGVLSCDGEIISVATTGRYVPNEDDEKPS